MAYKMFNEDFEEITIVNPDWKYLYVTDYEDFVREFGEEWILYGIERDGIYEYDECGEEWKERMDRNSFVYKTILEKVSSNVKGTKKGWNIIITLDTGEKIKTNTEPVSIEDVQEAIGVLVKPSILGMRIIGFEIVAE